MVGTGVEGDVPPVPPRRIQVWGPAGLALVIVALCVPVWLLVPGLPGDRHVSLPLFGAVFGAYALTELPAFMLRFEVRRHAAVISLTDIALVLGLFLLPPWAILAAGAAALIVILPGERGAWERRLFNRALFVADVTVAAALFNAVGHAGIDDTGSWPFAYAAVAAGSLVSAMSFYAVITLVQGRPSRGQVVSIVVTSLATGAISCTLGLAALMLVRVTAWSAVLIAVIIGVFGFAYRGYSRSFRERRTLSELYEFTSEVGSQASDGGLADTVLQQTREFLRAECATLWLPAMGSYPEIVLSALVDEGVRDEPAGPPDRIRSLAQIDVDTGVVDMSRSEDPELLRALIDRGVDEVIATPLRSGSTVIGVLEVTNRLGDGAWFGPDDARLLKTLAAHAGVAVENSRLVDRLRHDAYHDALTGLPNRRRFSDALDEAISVRPAPDEAVAVILLDLDSFKDVNDTLGHLAGDRLLVEVGRRLEDAAPNGALLARMGGDEFTLLLRLPSAEAAQREGSALLAVLTDPVDMDGLSIDVGGSVGIALFPDHGIDGGLLLQRAEMAMYAAKRAVRQVRVYQPTMDSLSVRRLALVGELRRAIDDEQLSVYYQPKIGLVDQQFIGVEALVRWHHPEQGVIDPDDFIPIAEHTGLIGPLTSYVLESTLRQCRRWLEDGRRLHVAVNISVRSLVDPDFADEVDRLLLETEVPAELLTLEITESGVMSEMDRSLPTLHRLRERGIKLSVDDFGTGQSSLTYLRRLPVTEVKIAKGFVLSMATDPGDLAVVRAIVDLGRHLGLNVVAEGVESEMAYQLLREMGCDVVQGFLLSRPVPYERLEAWIQARTVAAPSAAATGHPWLRVVNN